MDLEISLAAWPGKQRRETTLRTYLKAGVFAILMIYVLVLCIATPAAAEVRSTPLRDYARDVWTSRNGLPHNTLRDIQQTPEGHLWFATWEGVARYNGLEFTVFDRTSSPALPDNGIGALYVDTDGALWLGDSRGNVARFDQRGNWRQWTPAAGEAPHVIIEAMQKDSRGRLWLMYEESGLGRLDPEKGFTHYPAPKGLSAAVNYVHMAIDSHDRVWVGTFNGLLYLDTDGEMKPASTLFGELPKGLAWPYRAPDGTIWMVVSDHIYRMEGDSLVLKHRLSGVGLLTELLQDRKGDLWVGTENSGLWRIGPNGSERLEANDSLLDYRVISLLEDDEGSIWVGMNGGLMRLRETLFSSYSHTNGLSGDFVRTLAEDKKGQLWVGSSSGLDMMQTDGTFVPVSLRIGQQPSVLSLAAGASGDMWVGTRGQGVYHLDAAGQVKLYSAGKDLPHGNYRAIAANDKGQVWLGSAEGVLQMVNGKPTPVAIAGMPDSLVLALIWADDTLWIGTTEGTWRLHAGRVERLDMAGIGGVRAVFAFREVGDSVWISSDRGVYRYRAGKLAPVSLEQGMPVDTVFELIPDAMGNVWLSTNRGIWRTSMEAMNAVADGLQKRLSGEMYREIDGLISAQANGGAGPSAVRRQDGSVWVATAGGVVTVDPRVLQQFRERMPPQPVVESVLAGGQRLNWRGSEETVIPGGTRLAITYVGLSYLMPERIQYRTRLEGLDSTWVNRGNQRGVEYVGLPPGDYALHVSAAHPDGRWSIGAPLWRFTIKPLWWQRLDVRIAGAVLILLGFFALLRYMTHHFKSKNARLIQLVDERTHDLKLQAEHLLEANREKTGLAERLREQAEAFGRQAREDALTGLPNRRAFDEVLGRDFARSHRSSHPMSLVVLDIDHFKNVNDCWSHSVGDQVLSQVARLLEVGCRDSDLPARLGGEEFALLLNDTTLEGAIEVCARLRELFHAQVNWAGIPGLVVTFSAGVVQLTSDDRTPLQLCQRADTALYRAKSEGRDQACIG